MRADLTGPEIQDRFAREYVERILGQPRGVKTVVAYAVPAAGSLMGVFVFGIFLRRRSRTVRPAEAWSAGRQLDIAEFTDFE